MLETTLLFLIKDNKVLLAMKKRGFGANRYNGVGGKKEQNETIEQTLIRETKEEIDVTPIKYNKVAEITFDEYFKGRPTTLKMYVYISRSWSGYPTESEEMRPEWFNISKLPIDDMWPDDKFWVKTVLDGKKVKAKFKLDKDDNIIDHNLKVIKTF